MTPRSAGGQSRSSASCSHRSALADSTRSRYNGRVSAVRELITLCRTASGLLTNAFLKSKSTNTLPLPTPYKHIKPGKLPAELTNTSELSLCDSCSQMKIRICSLKKLGAVSLPLSARLHPIWHTYQYQEQSGASDVQWYLPYR